MPRKSPKVDAGMKLLRDGNVKTFAEAARRVGCSPSSLTTRWQNEESEPFQADDGDEVSSIVDKALALEEEPEVPEPSPEEKELARRLISAQSGRTRALSEARVAKNLLKEREEQIENLQKIIALKDEVARVARPEWLEFARDDGVHHATALALWSDYHFGEVVEASEMNWFNAYNPEIAEIRMRAFFEKTIMLSRTYLTGVSYDGIVMASLGDGISGNIHEEFMNTNELSNYEASVQLVPMLEEGIGNLADEFGKVHVPCVPGNHPRDSRQPRYKKRSAHNADTMIMQLVAQKFANDDRVTFDIPDGISADFQIYDTKFRAEHGDEAKGGGGIQGAMLPLALLTHKRRKQAEAEGTPFDVLLLGHWHQWMSLPTKGFVVNGSGKGFDEYARGKGFEPEEPQQALMIVTPEYGVSVQAPIFVGDREAEGW